MTPETTALIQKLAAEINKKFDVPGIPESIEGWAIESAFQAGLTFLPPQYLAWVTSAADGIDDTEAASLTDWLTGLLDQYGSNVPAMFHRPLAGIIVSLLRKGDALVIGT